MEADADFCLARPAPCLSGFDLETPISAHGTDGPTQWEPHVLSYALGELRREFPNVPAERALRAADMAARALAPASGRVELLQRARALL
jgi:hypothetical protein